MAFKKSKRLIALVSSIIPKRDRDPKDKRNQPAGGTGWIVAGTITFDPPNPTIAEYAPEDTYVTTIHTSVFPYAVHLIDDAGGRFKLRGNDIVAGSVPSSLLEGTYYIVTVRAGAGMNVRDASVTVTVTPESGDPGGGSTPLTDQLNDPILDQNGHFLWD